MSQLEGKYFYAHFNSPKVLFDVDYEPLSFGNNFPLGQNDKLAVSETTIYINTWIGSYFSFFEKGACNLLFMHKMYDLIYKSLNRDLGTNLKLKDIDEYKLTINFDKLDHSLQDTFLETHKGKKKVLLSNGPGLSGQCQYNGNMADMINHMAEENPNVIFIATHKFISNNQNVFFTDNINQRKDFDLNEIAYLSKFCDVVIGKSSGPFVFSLIDDNVNDPNKKMICFGSNPQDCHIYNIHTKCDYKFITYSGEQQLYKEIKEKVNVVLG